MSNFFVILLYALNSLQIINEKINSQEILCYLNDDCIITCDNTDNNGGLCVDTTIICQNSDYGVCQITCIGTACRWLSLIALHVKSVDIICGHANGISFILIFR